MVDMMKNMDSQVIDSLCSEFQDNNLIQPRMFSKYGVKRGLRNADGTGVLAGITCVSNVHGYMVNEGEVEPIEGRLTYRGHNLYDLLDGFDSEDRFGFAETSYLLLSGSLPDQEELQAFTDLLADACTLPDGFTEDVIMRAPSRDIMNKLAVSTLALYSYDPNPDNTSLENIVRQAVNLIAKFPVIISHAYQAKRRYFDNASMFLHMPDRNYTTAENILSLIRPDGIFTREEAMLLDRCLIIHAEHGGGNNSAFTTRVVSSSATDTYSAISAAIGSLKGPRHGGANLRVCRQFDEMKENIANWEDEEEVLAYLCKILRQEAGDGSGLIYGMGHAVYTLSDPRAVALKNTARPLALQKGFEREFNLIELTERLAPEAFYRVRGEHKIMCANVDMYSGLVYQMLGIPSEMFTPLFAAARIVGWLAHRIEETVTGGKIIRPAYKPIISRAKYIPISER
ncbi:MAG TPA: citrate/2-methylcitrate synthase [Candidatus Butyricicoccus stercorigallinarum]|nr:citrate/2-methylcitrate synthase [Candidatus Butyricicoccus stercorigallinarum]